MIICHCTGTTDATIASLARDGVDTVTEVTRRTGAGACCEPCRSEIAQLLTVHCGRTGAGYRAV